ncbi:MAG: type II secretion system minor pseudopilin GspI [Pseudomonadota bacterium]
MSGTGGQDAGFSLIEALVALAVLAIATIGLVGAMEQHIDSTRAMERRSAAMWVAENRLAELGIGAAAGDRVTMLDTNWRVATTTRATDDPEIARVRVDVFEEGGKSPTVSLDGFLDMPNPPAPTVRR